MIKTLLPAFVILSSCSSNVTESAKTGDCLRHKWESGVYRVKKTGKNQLVLEEIVKEGQIGNIKVISHLYGGWYLASCPESKNVE